MQQVLVSDAQIDRSFDVQVAYQIAEDASRPTSDLFWAIDCLRHDVAAQDEHVRHQRFEATQRMARILDARSVPVRDPRAAPAYPSPRR